MGNCSLCSSCSSTREAVSKPPLLETNLPTVFSGRMRSPRLLFCALSVISLSALTAEKPFEFASVPGKLPKQILPEEYVIRITPDLAKLTFQGSETVKLKVQQPVRKLVLNALEIKIASASLNGTAIPSSAIKLDPKEETLTLTFASDLRVTTHRSRARAQRRSCSERSSKRPMRAAFSPAGMSRASALAFN